MTEPFSELLRSWQNFYFMMGGAAATLAGLMFVALSLGSHLMNDVSRENMTAFVTPSMIYFVSVLLLAALMLVPTFSPSGLALALLIGGGVGLWRSLPHARALTAIARQHHDFTPADWAAQIIGPVASYSVLLLAALLFAVGQWSWGFAAAWGVMIGLLVCAIANTWGLVMWIVEQRRP